MGSPDGSGAIDRLEHSVRAGAAPSVRRRRQAGSSPLLEPALDKQTEPSIGSAAKLSPAVFCLRVRE